MGLLTLFMAVLLYIATATVLLGTAYRIFRYLRVPAPLKIPTTPAPTTTAGVAARLFREAVFFESLFRASKWTWFFGWLFHVGLLLAIVGHLSHFVPVDSDLGTMLKTAGTAGAVAMIFGLFGLTLRRLVVDRIRYISSPSDYLMLLLLIGIAVTGMAVHYVSTLDIDALKAFMRGLWHFRLSPFPREPLMVAHLCLVSLLLIVFPFSKLLHGPALFFSPTRNQADDARERRHITPWASAQRRDP